MKSTILKRSVVINRYKTSISLEDIFWEDLKEYAVQHNMTVGALVASIDDKRTKGGLSSSCRIFLYEKAKR